MDEAMKWARASGITKVELEVFPHNAPAITLYRKLGFEEEGGRRRYLIGGHHVDAVLMAIGWTRVGRDELRGDRRFVLQARRPGPRAVRAGEAGRGGAAGLGLDRVIKLASNEGPTGRSPGARGADARSRG